MTDRAQQAAELLSALIEVAELRQQLAEVQEQCVELAVDAGEMHADIEALRARLLAMERERDRWRNQANKSLQEAAERAGNGGTRRPG